jgi:autotransporter-associated beta strand protein
MKTKYTIIVAVAAVVMPLSLANAADYLFNNSTSNEVGGSPATLTGAPGGTVTISLQVNLGAAESTLGVDYWLTQFFGPTTGAFSIINRDYTGSDFGDPSATNAEVTSSGDTRNNSSLGPFVGDGIPDNQILPRNGFDLGSIPTVGFSKANGIFQIATFTLRIRSTAAPGTYNLRTFDYPLFGINDVTPAHQASINVNLPGAIPTPTWDEVPLSDNWNDANNWTPMTVPNGPADTATFAHSFTTGVSLSAVTQVRDINFVSSMFPSAYTITVGSTFSLTISAINGTGITNDSGVTQNFVANADAAGNFGAILFSNSATAGASTAFTNHGATALNATGGHTIFFDSSTADHGTFTNNGGMGEGAFGGVIEFHQSSTTADGTFTNDGGTTNGANGGLIRFFDSSTAGDGIFTNNAGNAGSTGGGDIDFNDTSTAGNATFTNNGGAVGGANGGTTRFFGGSTAARGAFTNNGAAVAAIGTTGGETRFIDASTAANGIFTNNGGTASGAIGGDTAFFGTSTAANATIINNGGTVSGAKGGGTFFRFNSTAGSATLVANGGTGGGDGGRIVFAEDSAGGTSRVEVFGNGNLDISVHNAPGVTVGSIEGSGKVFLGANNLSVGSNNMSTLFSGVVQDGGQNGGSGGSLTKIGPGTLTLSGPNTYTGPTTVNAGKLVVNGSITSAVTVNGGTLGGSGTTGSVTVNSGGVLSPGNSPGILHVAGNLSLALGSTCLVELNGPTAGTQYDQADVAGIVSLGDATLSVSLGFLPPSVTMFTIINNDLSDPVSGMFNGLPEGAMFTASGESFTISYQSGDGNDVVLTAAAATPPPTVPDAGGTVMLLSLSAAALLVLRSLSRSLQL